ncbi:MAG: Asp-tRNA(Asn)/Glu-tRNA(Gln) amidotransferase subunit GatA [Phycisphaerales bacterium]|jgi:aspartyl-tRNA(Asn)/glutamyl-tRNA(Gln) amidotransferase subunit A|nr:Asp-tRNA(Asn)/Glu-tRNA(Gln) amidotransferase subunit GatA [Phycisphaerales bacterium]
MNLSSIIESDKFNAFHEIWEDVPDSTDGKLKDKTIAIKDNIATKIGTTTCGSKMLAGYKSPFNATVIDRLEDEGAILVGKTNCDEFAMGSSTEHCAWGPVLNPWDTSRVPGGSSGGSAAVVAAGLCDASLGSDTGGSIRQPAAFCGVVGYKPTYGLVSRYGLVAFASSLDQIGTFTKSVEDAALIVDVFSGPDELDSTCRNEEPPNLSEDLNEHIPNLRIGVPSQYIGDQNEPDVNAAINTTIETYVELGATIVNIDLPLTDVGISTYYVLAPAECSSNLARYDGIRYGHRTDVKCKDLFEFYSRNRAEGLGKEVKRRIMLGTYVLSSGYYDAYYNNALKVRRLICSDYETAFNRCDVILGPTTPTVAFKIGEKQDPLSMYLCDIYTANTNIAGICGISIPCGFSENGLPIGLHLQGGWYEDSKLLRAAQMFQSATDFHTKSPENQ